MKPVMGLVLMMFLQTAPLPPQVDIVQPKDPAITLLPGGSSPSGLPVASPYAVTLRNNSTHDITGLVVEWLAGGPPTTLLLDGDSLKRPVVPAKGMFTLMPPHDIKPRMVKNLKPLKECGGRSHDFPAQLFLKPQEQVQSRLDDPVW